MIVRACFDSFALENSRNATRRQYGWVHFAEMNLGHAHQ